MKSSLAFVVKVCLVADVLRVAAQLRVKFQRLAVDLGLQACQRDLQRSDFCAGVRHGGLGTFFLQRHQNLTRLDDVTFFDMQLCDDPAIWRLNQLRAGFGNDQGLCASDLVDRGHIGPDKQCHYPERQQTKPPQQ